VLASVDALVGSGRAALREREADIRATEVEVARAVSRSLEAYQRYHQGKLCLERPSQGHSWLAQDCDRHFRAALAIDPDFALAHFELAQAAFGRGVGEAELRAALGPAVARAERMPAADRDQLRVFQAWADGDESRAVELARRAARSFPEDARTVASLGGLLAARGRLSEAVAPLERALALDPGLEPVLDQLVWALGRLDRVEALRTLAARLQALDPTPGRRHAEVLARGWAGDVEGALAAARRAAEGGGEAAAEDLADALVAAGRLDEAEPLVRAAAAREGDGIAHSRLASFLLLQGRRREALAVMEANRAAAQGPRERFYAAARDSYRRADERDAGALRRLAASAPADQPDLAGGVAPLLAYAGDVEAALELAPSCPGQPEATLLVEGLVAWRRQGAVAALPSLRALAEGDPGGLGQALAPPEAIFWLHAECAAEAAPDEEALRALRRFQRAWRPLGPWRAWAHPRSLLLEARLLEGLGRRAEAGTALARLEALWARADPGQPLLADLRALRRRLGAGGAAGAPPDPGQRGPATRGESR
jgi:tetratricopeptide (TPR) repeat protein